MSLSTSTLDRVDLELHADLMTQAVWIAPPEVPSEGRQAPSARQCTPVAADVEDEGCLAGRQAEQREAELVVPKHAVRVLVQPTCRHRAEQTRFLFTSCRP